TLDLGLQLHVSSASQLTAFTDVDWAACRVTLSRSSAEEEYRGVANVVAETAWIWNLLLELHAPLTTATLVYCDNVSDVYLSTNHVQHQRTKHIEVDIHFVRDYVASGQRSKSRLFLSQSKFAEEILKRAHMQHCNPCKTHVDTESKLGFDGDPHNWSLDNKGDVKPKYDADAISEVNVSQINLMSGMLSKDEHDSNAHDQSFDIQIP
nr:hypothetical protein [Tanacetum cinerariifolium]